MQGAAYTNRWTRTLFSRAKAAGKPSRQLSTWHTPDKVQYET